MAKLYRHGAYFYMNKHPELYSWNTIYKDYECTQELDKIYGKEFYESSYTKEPPVLFRQEAITNIVRANLHRNELRYLLWELEKATKSGKDTIEVQLENPLASDTFKCLNLLGYTITSFMGSSNKYRISL